ncbi:MAG: photosynthetic complex assembly protein PuhC [Janthinobacterium lividum]
MSATLFGTSGRTPRRIPWPPLIALALTALIGLVAALPTAREAPAGVVSTRSMVVDASDDGAVLLIDGETGAVAGRIAAGGESFVRGILHGAAVSRRLFGVDQRVPYRLTALSDGRLTLSDAATNITIDLTSFGSTNARSFALLLDRPAQEPR